MKIDKILIEQLLQKLKKWTTRWIHLKAIAWRSATRIDIAELMEMSTEFREHFLEKLLTKEHFKITFSVWDTNSKKRFFKKNNVDENSEDIEKWEDEFKKKTGITLKRLWNIIKQTQDYESNSWINTFWFWFPMVVRNEKNMMWKDQIIIAPLIIWNLNIDVEVKQLNTFTIEYWEDNYFMNNEILESHLEMIDKVKAPKLNTEELDSVSEKEMKNLVNEFMKILSPEREIPEFDIKSIKAIPDLSNKLDDKFSLYWWWTFWPYKQQNQAIKNNTETLLQWFETIFANDPNELKFEHSFGVIEADPSQQETLDAIKNNKDLIIQWPPWTWKSQTITSLLTNNLSQWHISLVVCEKRTALEVILKNLEKTGLSQYCTIIEDPERDRKATVTQVREFYSDYSWWLSRYSSEYNQFFDKQNYLIEEINNQHQLIWKKIFNERNWTESIWEFIKLKKNVSEQWTIEEIEKYITDVLGDKDLDECNKTLSLLIEEWAKYFNKKWHNQLQYIKIDAIKNISMFDWYDKYNQQLKLIDNEILTTESDTSWLEKHIQDFSNILEWVDWLKKRWIKSINDYCTNLSRIDTVFWKYNITENFWDKLKEINKARKKIEQLWNKLEWITLPNILDGFSVINELSNVLWKIEIESQKIKDKIIDINVMFKNIKNDAINILWNIKRWTQEYDDFLAKKRHAFMENITLWFMTSNSKHKNELKNNIFWLTDTLISECKKIYDENYLDNVEDQNAVKICNIYDLLNGIVEIFDNSFNIEDIKLESINQLKSKEWEIVSTIWKISKDILSMQELCMKIFEIKSKNFDYKITTIDNIRQVTEYVRDIMKDKKMSFDDFSILCKRWDFYCKIDKDCRSLIDIFIKNWISTDHRRICRDIAYLNKVLKKNYDSKIPRDEKNIKELAEIMSKFKCSLSDKIQTIQINNRDFAKWEFQHNHTYTIEWLFNLKSWKNVWKRRSLRNIIAADFNFFTTFFPIILTTPSACAEIFPVQKNLFDVVIFDEASQLKLEDTLQCLIRWKRKVICWDDKQMPPSTFFESTIDWDKLVSNDNYDEFDPELAGSESLLDFCTKIWDFQQRMLKIHYRSEHPDLIEFSNHAYYWWKLHPFPAKTPYTPIHFITVNWVYADNTNEAEANEVLNLLKRILDNYNKNKLPSIWIWTFNIHQRNLILDKINKIKWELSDFADKLNSYDKNTFFVKNLDSLQWDERDIIIVSTTFWKDENWKFSQRFWPISSQEKWHRFLNVMISRAKKELYVLTSIPEDYYMWYEEAVTACWWARQSAWLYAWLAYCKAVSSWNEELKNNVLSCINISSRKKNNVSISWHTESPFEEEVRDILTKIIPSWNTIELNKQEAGFRLDIAILTKAGNKIAIECDGASYHGTNQDYAWDIFRQKRIEDNCGYIFHRIWSTNWRIDQDKEIIKLTNFLRDNGAFWVAKDY